MATMLRGKRKGETVVIHQFANDWVSLEDGAIVNPTSLAYTAEERTRIAQDTGKGMWLYEWKGDRLVPYRTRQLRDGYGRPTGEWA